MRKFAAQRVMERDGVSHELAMARIANQKSWEEYKALSDVVLDNSGDLAGAACSGMENITRINR